MKKIFLKSFLFAVFIIISGVYFASQISAAEYPLSSLDGKVKTVFDSKFGGGITKIYDFDNLGNQNLVLDSQSGAMFQNAFWLDPKHLNPPWPAGCAGNNDQLWSNPTQAGYIFDGLAGNPIGVFGITNTADPKEFIRLEENGNKIHFKSRFIRYDFCSGQATTDSQKDWDTNFYVEQWASFSPQFSHTLVLKTKISYEGDYSQWENSDTDTVHNGHPVTKQWPIIFGLNLTRIAYIKNGVKTFESTTDHHFDPDGNWAALLSSTKDTGIGMILDGKVVPRQGGKFGGGIGSGNQPGHGVVNWGFLYPGPWLDLKQFGTLVNVTPDGWGGYAYKPEGYFEWTAYYPIGSLSMIEQVANTIAASPLPGVTISNLRSLFQNFTNIFDYNNLVGNFGK